MSEEILNNMEENEAEDKKELLNKRKEQQFLREASLFKTDEKEKEKAIERMEQEAKLEEAIRPYANARKVIIGICILMWAFAAFCLLSGALEMNMFLPMCLFALCALAAVNAPIFFIKKQIKDMIIATLCAVVCFFFAVVIFVFG